MVKIVLLTMWKLVAKTRVKHVVKITKFPEFHYIFKLTVWLSIRLPGWEFFFFAKKKSGSAIFNRSNHHTIQFKISNTKKSIRPWDKLTTPTFTILKTFRRKREKKGSMKEKRKCRWKRVFQVETLSTRISWPGM